MSYFTSFPAIHVIGLLLAAFLALARTEAPVPYPSCFRYRQTFSVSSTADGVHDIQLNVDTSSLKTSGASSDCSDIRFYHDERSEWLAPWYETTCSYSGPTSRIWVSPYLNSTLNTTISVFFDCRDETGSDINPSTYSHGYVDIGFTGLFYQMTRGTCSGPWSTSGIFGDRFLRVVNGATGTQYSTGTYGHTHSTSSVLSAASSAGTFAYDSEGCAISSHTHTMSTLSISAADAVTYPPYRQVVWCYDQKLDYYTDFIWPVLGTYGTRPSGLRRHTELDSRFSRGYSSYGGTGGSTTHTHYLSGSVGATASSYQKNCNWNLLGSWRSNNGHTHSITSTWTNSGSNLPTRTPTVFIEMNGGVEGSVPWDQGQDFIHFTTKIPPKGFEWVPDSHTGTYFIGSSSPGSKLAKGDAKHTATIHSNTNDGASELMTGSGGGWVSDDYHDHPASTYSTSSWPNTDELERVEMGAVVRIASPQQDGIVVSSIQEIRPTYWCGAYFNEDVRACTDLRGVCQGQDDCNCTFGFVGNDCEFLECFGIRSENSSFVCSGHGSCVAVGITGTECVCDDWHIGEECDTMITCNGTLADNETVCSNHGDCLYSNDNCVCDTGYAGDWCELFICDGIVSDNVSYVCSAHGECVEKDNCTCDPLWYNSTCEMPVTCFDYEYYHHLSCLGHGECVGMDDCVCRPGYDGNDCDATSCYDYASTDEQVCNAVGRCWGRDLCLCPRQVFGRECKEKLDSPTVTLLGNETDEYLTLKIPYEVEASELPLHERHGWFDCSHRVIENSNDVFGNDSPFCYWEHSTSPTSLDWIAFLRLNISNPWVSSQNDQGENEDEDRRQSNKNDDDDKFVRKFQNHDQFELLLRLVTSMNIYERAFVTVIVRLIPKPVPPAAGNFNPGTDGGTIAGIVVPLVLILFCALGGVAILVVWMFLYRRKMSRFSQLEDVDILIKEQEAAKDKSVAHVRFDQSVFEISWDDLELERMIGKGGSDASVFLANYQGGVQVAVKLFKTSSLGNQQHVFEEFEAEVSMLGSLLHPFILKFFGATLHPPRIGIVTEYCVNGDLDDFLQTQRLIRGEAYPLREKLRMLQEVCSAIEYIHKRDIIHRDIKLQNVLVTHAEETRLMDFGLSKTIAAGGASLLHTQRVGTSFFMAPEVFLGFQYNRTCDIFSLSMFMYLVLSDSQAPFETAEGSYNLNSGEFEGALEARIATDPLFRPSFALPVFEKCLWITPLIHRGWNADPTVRPTAAEIVTVIKEITGDEDKGETAVLQANEMARASFFAEAQANAAYEEEAAAAAAASYGELEQLRYQVNQLYVENERLHHENHQLKALLDPSSVTEVEASGAAAAEEVADRASIQDPAVLAAWAQHHEMMMQGQVEGVEQMWVTPDGTSQTVAEKEEVSEEPPPERMPPAVPPPPVPEEIWAQEAHDVEDV